MAVRDADLEDPETPSIALQYLIGCVDNVAVDDAILTCDSGTVATWAAPALDHPVGGSSTCPENFASMAPGLPYAIAMQHAFRSRQVILRRRRRFAMLMAEF